jgi:hypothetical protein
LTLRIVLAIIPIAMLTVVVPLVNRVEPRIFGLPFLLAWIAFWVLVSPIFVYTIYRLDNPR